MFLSRAAALSLFALPASVFAATHVVTLDYDGRLTSDNVCGSRVGDSSRLDEEFNEIKVFQDPLDEDESIVSIEVVLWTYTALPGELTVMLNGEVIAPELDVQTLGGGFEPLYCTPVFAVVESEPALRSWEFGGENTFQILDDDVVFTQINYAELIVRTQRVEVAGCAVGGPANEPSFAGFGLLLALLALAARPRTIVVLAAPTASTVMAAVLLTTLSPTEVSAQEAVVSVVWEGGNASCASCGETAVCSDEVDWAGGVRQFDDPLHPRFQIDEVTVVLRGFGTALPTRVFLGDEQVGDMRRFPSLMCTTEFADCLEHEFVGEAPGREWPGYVKGRINELRVEVDDSEEDARLCLVGGEVRIAYSDVGSTGGCGIGSGARSGPQMTILLLVWLGVFQRRRRPIYLKDSHPAARTRS